MIPTLHFRWAIHNDYHGGDVLIPSEVRVLQQFVEILDHESDITLPREIGPTGHEGRWIDVPEHRP